MRVLLVNRFFGGKQVPTGRMLADVAAHLVEDGHQVTAVAGDGAYADEPGEEMGTAGVRVRRLWTGGNRARVSSWLLFWGQALALMPMLRWDRCVVLTDPPFLVLGARLAKAVHPRRKVYWWTMDLYPEALTADGLIRRDGLVEKGLRLINNTGLKALDGVIPLGRRQEERLRTYPQWREAPSFSQTVPPWDDRPLERLEAGNNKVVQRFGWQGRKVVLYAGNLGRGHVYEDVLAAARSLHVEGDQEWLFAFFCRGARRETLTQEARDLPNVLVSDYVSPAETADLLHAADVHLITMADGWDGVAVPSKLYGVIKTGAPVLFVGPEGADTADEIHALGAGRTLRSGCGGQAVVDTLRELDQWERCRPEVERNGARDVADFISREDGPQEALGPGTAVSCAGPRKGATAARRQGSLPVRRRAGRKGSSVEGSRRER